MRWLIALRRRISLRYLITRRWLIALRWLITLRGTRRVGLPRQIIGILILAVR